MSVAIRRAVIRWSTGQRATLTVAGWTVAPFDSELEALLNDRYSLAAAQAKRESLVPDLLGTAAKRAALALGAEVIAYDLPSVS